MSDDHIAEAVAAMKASYVPETDGTEHPDESATEPRTLDELLNDTATFVRRYVVLSDQQRDAAALWITHTHALDAFDVTPYLAVTSPERRSGKSRLLDVFDLLVARPWRAVEPSEAVVFRKIEADTPTLLLDEVDAIFGRKRDTTEGLRALLNAGNARGTKVPRCVGPSQSLTEFSIFCAKALAGIGKLPDTVADRSISIAMKRKVRDEPCERFRRRRAREDANKLRDDLAQWSESATGSLRERLDEVAALANDGKPLAALDDRAFEAWEPLLAIAAVAGEGWEQRARSAALALSGSRDSEPESLGLRLLADVYAVFVRLQVDRMTSQGLVNELVADTDGPWADWYGKPVSPNAVAKLLTPFGIRPRTIRIDDDTTAKGYQRGAFEEAWKRYSPHLGASQPSQPSQTSSHAGLRPFSEPSQEGLVTDAESAAKPHEHSVVTAVTDGGAGEGENGVAAGSGRPDQWLTPEAGFSDNSGPDPGPPRPTPDQDQPATALGRGPGQDPGAEKWLNHAGGSRWAGVERTVGASLGNGDRDWRTRDGVWHSPDERPAFPGEVVETRPHVPTNSKAGQ